MTVTSAAAGLEAIDPITFEVIRHRLWAINDDQAMIASRLSGSPVVYEAYDFNAGLLTADGENLLSGIYIVHHAATMDVFIHKILDEWPRAEIRPGDMFFSNDPWSGALHANDGILACPFFHGGELIAWGAIVMHDQDVGSSVPGSFVVGAEDRFSEAPLVPVVKLVEDYEIRHDIESMILRNHRTPELNALNLRARLAALTMSQERVAELIDRYGLETFRAAQQGILDHVEQVLRRKLLQIPDGEWTEEVYLDHDGNRPARYPIRCALRKQGDELTVDFSGTAAQARGAVNCARPALEGATFGVVLSCLCYDVPWSVGALRRVVRILSVEGSINNAIGDAAVSMASIMATLITQNAVANAFGKMLYASEALREEAQAVWGPGHNVVVYAGYDQDGVYFAGPVLDAMGGGGGARFDGDGVNAAGDFGSMSATIPNVETTESRYPLLVLYRHERRDSCGHGRFRGGVGIEFAMLAHRNRGPVAQISLASGVEQPPGNGIGGGSAPSVNYNRILRGTDVLEQFAQGRLPAHVEQITTQSVEPQQAKDRTQFGGADVHLCGIGGGGGLGDPLRRDPASVAVDLAEGLVSDEIAARVYGVVVEGSVVDEDATERRRREMRAARREQASPPRRPHDWVAADGAISHTISDGVLALETERGSFLCCTVCQQVLAEYGEDFRDGAGQLDVSPLELSASNACTPAEESVFRQSVCPGCGTVLDSELRITVPLEPVAQGVATAGDQGRAGAYGGSER
jgi:N-methylhydantoinase B